MQAILDDVAAGSPLHVAIRKHGSNDKTFYRALDANPDAAQRYARAREVRNDRLAEETLRIADNCKDPQKAKLQVDTRKWLLSKLAPKKYGDRTVIAGDPDAPLVVDAKDELLRGLGAGAAAGGNHPAGEGAE